MTLCHTGGTPMSPPIRPGCPRDPAQAPEEQAAEKICTDCDRRIYCELENRMRCGDREREEEAGKERWNWVVWKLQGPRGNRSRRAVKVGEKQIATGCARAKVGGNWISTALRTVVCQCSGAGTARGRAGGGGALTNCVRGCVSNIGLIARCCVRFLSPADGFCLSHAGPKMQDLQDNPIRAVNVVSKYGSNVGTARTNMGCLLYTSPSPRDRQKSRMPSSA